MIQESFWIWQNGHQRPLPNPMSFGSLQSLEFLLQETARATIRQTVSLHQHPSAFTTIPNVTMPKKLLAKALKPKPPWSHLIVSSAPFIMFF
jgi:hypothetical protein